MSKNFAVLDVETTMIKDGEYPRTLFWGLADSRGYKRFDSTKKLLVYLRHETNELTLLHHSNFDVLQLLLDGANIQILRSHNSRLIRCKIYRHTLLNSYSCFPLSLASIFSCFGFKKTPLVCKNHVSGDDEQYDCPECKRLLSQRNYEDCVNGLECFLSLDSVFSRLVNVSPLEKGTIAGTSFTAAQNTAGAKLPKDERFLEAYRGGRVEVFNTNKTIAKKYDINSSYPFSFIDCPVADHLLCLRVSTEDFYCPLYDACVDDSLIFPNGSFVSYCFESNLERYILPNATKTKIKVLKRTKIDFSWLKSVVPLVETLYRLKNETKEDAIKTACKLLLNSMYGRIGLKGDSERARILDYYPDSEESTIFKLGKRKYLCFDTVYRETKSNYPFAAFITDNARARLYQSFVRTRPHYGDTDSVMFPADNVKDFAKEVAPCGSNIGEWKFEGMEPFKANNVKDYFWGEKEVLKGGSGFTQWTLKTLASGKKPTTIQREKISALRKRVTTFGGETLPLIVNR